MRLACPAKKSSRTMDYIHCSFFFHKGSPESHDPDKRPTDESATPLPLGWTVWEILERQFRFALHSKWIFQGLQDAWL